MLIHVASQSEESLCLSEYSLLSVLAIHTNKLSSYKFIPAGLNQACLQVPEPTPAQLSLSLHSKRSLLPVPSPPHSDSTGSDPRVAL